MFKLIENLDNYFILNEGQKEAVIGTYLMLKVTDTENLNIFQPCRSPVDKNFPVFFLITCKKKDEKGSKMKNNFTEKELPILYLENIKEIPKTAEEFRKKLNDFVKSPEGFKI